MSLNSSHQTTSFCENQCIYEVGLEVALALTIQEFHPSNIARNKASGYRIVANKNKYMGKVLPLEELLSKRSEVFTQQTLGGHGGGLVDWTKVVSWTDLISLS